MNKSSLTVLKFLFQQLLWNKNTEYFLSDCLLFIKPTSQSIHRLLFFINDKYLCNYLDIRMNRRDFINNTVLTGLH